MKIQDRLGGLRLAKLPQRTDLEVTLRTEGNCRWLPSVNVLSKAYFYTQHAPGSHAEVRELLPEVRVLHRQRLHVGVAEVPAEESTQPGVLGVLNLRWNAWQRSPQGTPIVLGENASSSWTHLLEIRWNSLTLLIFRKHIYNIAYALKAF